jgi:hypothetical protein
VDLPVTSTLKEAITHGETCRKRSPKCFTAPIAITVADWYHRCAAGPQRDEGGDDLNSRRHLDDDAITNRDTSLGECSHSLVDM